MAKTIALLQQAGGANGGIQVVSITTTEFAFFAALLLVLIGIIGYLLSEIRKRDRDDSTKADSGLTTFSSRLDSIADRMSNVTVDFERAAAAIKDWANVSFVPRPEYEGAVEGLKGDMDLVRRDVALHAERFQRELDLHIRLCPRGANDTNKRGQM